MSLEFNVDEIFEMAEEIERNGSAFYSKAAEMAKNAGTKALLDELSQWELTHLERFIDLREHLANGDIEKQVFDPENEAGLYLKAMADGHVFNLRKGVKDLIKGNESMQDIFNTALRLEKDSIVFYLGMRDMVASNSGKDKVMEIINEEMKHISYINREMAQL